MCFSVGLYDNKYVCCWKHLFSFFPFVIISAFFLIGVNLERGLVSAIIGWDYSVFNSQKGRENGMEKLPFLLCLIEVNNCTFKNCSYPISFASQDSNKVSVLIPRKNSFGGFQLVYCETSFWKYAFFFSSYLYPFSHSIILRLIPLGFRFLNHSSENIVGEAVR